MTCRPLLWITASAVVLGAAAWSPAPAGAQAAGWTVSIADPGPIESHAFEVAGSVSYLGGPVESVTVTLVPRFTLPASCGPAPSPTTVAPSGDGTYRAAMEVTCNGPYQVQVVATSKPVLGSLVPMSSGEPERQDVGVAEPPEPPLLEWVEASTAGAIATWSAAPSPDAAGWIIRVNETVEHQYDDPAATSAELQGDFGSATFDMRALRWGAEGPGTGAIASDVSNEWLLSEHHPPGSTPGTTPNSEPPPPPGGGPSTTPTPPGGATPTPTTGARIPTRGQDSQATLPEGYTEELPFGTVDDAFVPGSSTTVPDTDEEQAFGGTSPSAGLVRTTEKTSPGLVAPFALALLMITIAAHIAWYLRRSRSSGGGGQVSLP